MVIKFTIFNIMTKLLSHNIICSYIKSRIQVADGRSASKTFGRSASKTFGRSTSKTFCVRIQHLILQLIEINLYYCSKIIGNLIKTSKHMFECFESTQRLHC